VLLLGTVRATATTRTHIHILITPTRHTHTCLCPDHRFVGWVKGFVMGRNKPATSVINAYTRLTFLRRMPPAIRAKYTQHSNTATFQGALGQFLRPFETLKNSGIHTHTHISHSSLFFRVRPLINHTIVHYWTQ
jgi:hypothetical protein